MNSTNTVKKTASRSILAIVRFNLLIALLWGISLMLERAGIPFFTPLFGFFALWAPGICIALLLEQISESSVKPLLLIIWGVLLSFTFTPAGVYALSFFIFKQPPVTDVISPFLLWWGLVLVITLFVTLFKRQPTMIGQLSPDRTTSREIAYIIGAYALIMIINFIVYPLLPEGDGYAYLINWKSIQTNPSLFSVETRPLFLIFVNLCTQILHIDSYWVFKVLLPLSGLTMILSCYVFCRSFISDSRYRILFALSPLFFPVVLQESLISRPQSLILVSFIPSLVLISEVMSNRKNLRRIYWLVALFVIGALGIKVHTLFVFIALVSLLSIVIFLWPEIVKRPIDSIVIALGLLVIVSPQLMQGRIIPDSWHVLNLFAQSFRLGQFDFWFIDHYRNVDGIELGWPGYLSLFYYGYNLGLVFLTVVLILFLQRRLGTIKAVFKTKYWAIIFLFLLFFFIAEIAPRFKIAYLPDRAWLFISLLLALALPVMIAGIKNSQRYLLFIAVICFLSLASGTVLTYAKQGWVTPEEVEVAPFINENIPENAIILAQGGTRMMVRFYTGRASVRPNDEAIYLTGERAALDAYLKNEESAYIEAQSTIPRRKLGIDSTLNNLPRTGGKIALTDQDRQRLYESLRIIEDQEKNYNQNMERLAELYPTVGRPVYLIYNKNKFSSLYGTRSWWRASNFYGTNIERLNANYPVIYNKNGITIWEAKR